MKIDSTGEGPDPAYWEIQYYKNGGIAKVFQDDPQVLNPIPKEYADAFIETVLETPPTAIDEERIFIHNLLRIQRNNAIGIVNRTYYQIDRNSGVIAQNSSCGFINPFMKDPDGFQLTRMVVAAENHRSQTDLTLPSPEKTGELTTKWQEVTVTFLYDQLGRIKGARPVVISEDGSLPTVSAEELAQTSRVFKGRFKDFEIAADRDSFNVRLDRRHNYLGELVVPGTIPYQALMKKLFPRPNFDDPYLTDPDKDESWRNADLWGMIGTEEKVPAELIDKYKFRS